MEGLQIGFEVLVLVAQEKGVGTVWEGATQGRKEREDGETGGERLHHPELTITSFYFRFWTVPSGIVSQVVTSGECLHSSLTLTNIADLCTYP